MDQDHITPTDLAHHLGIHPATIRRWITRGHINTTRTPGGHNHLDGNPEGLPMRRSGPAADYEAEIGARLRRVRNRLGWSLDKVEERSDGMWKAVVVGSYERGDRSVTLGRLHQLCAFYRIRVADVLPDGPTGATLAATTVLALRSVGWSHTTDEETPA